MNRDNKHYMYIFEDDTVYIIIRRTCQWNTSHDFQFSLHVSLSNSFCFSLQMNLEGRFSEKINGITMKATNVNNLFFLTWWSIFVYSCQNVSSFCCIRENIFNIKTKNCRHTKAISSIQWKWCRRKVRENVDHNKGYMK